MVYMSGSRNARNQASIVNRTNICGGMKKGGLTPRIGWYMSSNPSMIGATNTQFGLLCIPNRTVQTQKYGYHAVHGGNMG
jgi:hypothetical protein